MEIGSLGDILLSELELLVNKYGAKIQKYTSDWFQTSTRHSQALAYFFHTVLNQTTKTTKRLHYARYYFESGERHFSGVRINCWGVNGSFCSARQAPPLATNKTRSPMAHSQVSIGEQN